MFTKGQGAPKRRRQQVEKRNVTTTFRTTEPHRLMMERKADALGLTLNMWLTMVTASAPLNPEAV